MRRDSPNGKRYVRKHDEERVAFGFDLSPLYCRSEEVARAAEAVREAEDRVRRLREVVSLMRRDLAALAEFGEEIQPDIGLWDQLRDKAVLTARALRRKLTLEDILVYRADLEALLDHARNVIDGPETEEVNTNDASFESGKKGGVGPPDGSGELKSMMGSGGGHSCDRRLCSWLTVSLCGHRQWLPSRPGEWGLLGYDVP